LLGRVARAYVRPALTGRFPCTLFVCLSVYLAGGLFKNGSPDLDAVTSVLDSSETRQCTRSVNIVRLLRVNFTKTDAFGGPSHFGEMLITSHSLRYCFVLLSKTIGLRIPI